MMLFLHSFNWFERISQNFVNSNLNIVQLIQDHSKSHFFNEKILLLILDSVEC